MQLVTLSLTLALACLIGCAPDQRGNVHPTDGSVVTDSDAAMQGGVTDGGTEPTPIVYAHSAGALYSIDPTTLVLTKVADFGWPFFPDQMNDIALDSTGNMIGVSAGSVYKIDSTTAKCTYLSIFAGSGFNGLSFIASGSSGSEVLVGANQDGSVYRIDPSTGTPTQIGAYGNGWGSSGDLVSVQGATYATVTTGSGNDQLVSVDPATGIATAIGDTGVQNIWGLGYWRQKVFGFTENDGIVTIDIATGHSTPIAGTSSVQWYGAGVTTSAPTTVL